MLLRELRFLSVLNNIPERKLVFLLAAPKGRPTERAIVILEKFDYDPSHWQELFDHASEAVLLSENESVREMAVTVPSDLNKIKAFVQWNVQPADIAKMTGSPMRYLRETPEDYALCTSLYIASEIERGKNEWIDRLLCKDRFLEAHSHTAAAHQYASTLSPESLALLDERRKTILRISRMNLSDNLKCAGHLKHPQPKTSLDHFAKSFMSSMSVSSLASGDSMDSNGSSGGRSNRPRIDNDKDKDKDKDKTGEYLAVVPGAVEAHANGPIPLLNISATSVASPLMNSPMDFSERPEDGGKEPEELLVFSPTRKVPNLVYSDDIFIIIPDAKWDRVNIEQLYLLAITRQPITCLRELRAVHVPLLEHVRDKAHSVLRNMFQLEPQCLRLFIHYLPSYFHLHVHAVNSSFSPKGIDAGKAHLLDDVIDNLKLDSDHYAKRTLGIVLRETHPVYQKLRQNQMQDDENS
eukprot:ANDGO_07592.mRNA.1 m7GpppX diphosphatase